HPFRLAVWAARRGPGGPSARRLAVSRARLAGHPALHGDRAVGGDGVQPDRRPPDRRREPADGHAAHPERPALRRLGRDVQRRLLDRLGSLDLAVPAESLALNPLGAGPGVVAGLLVCEAVHEPGPLLAGGGFDAGADRGLDRLARGPRLAAGFPRPGGAVLG